MLSSYLDSIFVKAVPFWVLATFFSKFYGSFLLIFCKTSSHLGKTRQSDFPEYTLM